MHNFQNTTMFSSECLGVNSCKYNGQVITHTFVESLKPYVNIINVCAEMSIGLRTPRSPVRVVYENNESKFI